ncbi:hypothetical protein F7O43_08375 [Neisseria meningitidis]|nr:hypothetical protein [Neisseria meningitidis]MBG8919030.1 hypothetical protein [Neisseria meningitidis]MBG8948405.1 hypothetical protein [Neisseria meningitidis]
MSKTVGIVRFNRNCPTQTVVLKHIARLLVRCLFRLPRWWDIVLVSCYKQWEVDLESQY